MQHLILGAGASPCQAFNCIIHTLSINIKLKPADCTGSLWYISWTCGHKLLRIRKHAQHFHILQKSYPHSFIPVWEMSFCECKYLWVWETSWARIHGVRISEFVFNLKWKDGLMFYIVLYSASHPDLPSRSLASTWQLRRPSVSAHDADTLVARASLSSPLTHLANTVHGHLCFFTFLILKVPGVFECVHWYRSPLLPGDASHL